jgi:site-specific DNA-methyltransferase (adenine-specific)
MNCLYNDDCFKVMPQLPENSVDMVLLDLPYGCISSAWDCKIDLAELWKNLDRVCKPQAQIVMFCTTRFGFELIASKREWFRYDLVWEKGTAVGFLNCNRQPLRKHEMIYVFSKETGTYNPQKTLGHKPAARLNAKPTPTATDIYGAGHVHLPSKDTDETRHPTSIIFCQRDNTNKRIHPTMKPLELCRLLVRQYSNENDVVLDCCMGSGTSVVAAKLEKRQYIGIEMSEAFYKVASYRIDKSETDPMALLMDTEVHDNVIVDNPDPTIIYSTYATEVGKKAEYKKNRSGKKEAPKDTTYTTGDADCYGEQYRTGRAETRKKRKIEPAALIETETMPETTPVAYDAYNRDVRVKKYNKKTKKTEVPVEAEMVGEAVPTVSFKTTRVKKVKKEATEPTTSTAVGVYGSAEKGVPRTVRKKKIVVVDPAFNEVIVEVENLTIEDTSVPCEVVSDIDEIQVASLNCC